MKNFKKIICLVLTILICFSLSGCKVIDRMRNSQIHYNKNQNLVYNNKVYKLLPDCEAFAPNMENREFLYVTDKDVPVLLSRIIGNEANITEDKKFITFEDKNYIPQYYAREDLYDDIDAIMAESAGLTIEPVGPSEFNVVVRNKNGIIKLVNKWRSWT